MVPAYLSITLVTDRKIGTKTCEVYLHDLCLNVSFTFRSLTDGVCHLYSFVFLCLNDEKGGGRGWPATSGRWLCFTRCCQDWLKCLMYGQLFLHWSTSPGCFHPRIGLVTMDLLYVIFTYWTHDNHQECVRLSNWFSLWCLGPLMNHLRPVWWSNFRFMFLHDSWCVSLAGWRGSFYCRSAFILAFIHCPSFTYYFPLIWFYSDIAFVLRTWYSHIL